MDHFTVFHRPSCPYSRHAIDTLQRVLPDPTRQLELVDIMKNKIDLVEVLKQHKVFNHKTVPAIFCNDVFVGGDSDLQAFLIERYL